MPFAAFLLSLIGMTLGIQPPRAQKTWGSSLSMGLGVLVFVFYYALLSIGIAAAESGSITPIVAVWIPNIATFIIAIILSLIHI